MRHEVSDQQPDEDRPPVAVLAEIARVLQADAPTFDVPFSLTAPKRRERRPAQPALFSESEA